jgi:hypothetical protein
MERLTLSLSSPFLRGATVLLWPSIEGTLLSWFTLIILYGRFLGYLMKLYQLLVLGRNVRGTLRFGNLKSLRKKMYVSVVILLHDQFILIFVYLTILSVVPDEVTSTFNI